MRQLFFLYCLLIAYPSFAQGGAIPSTNSYQSKSDTIKKDVIAPIDQYRFISIERDTTYLDTSLTIQREYSFNYLRRDNFGLLAFPNEGQTYNTLQYSLTKYSPYPEFGFKAKHFGFLEANDIKYSSVATPVTELYYKSTMTKGQSVDSFFTLNITPGLNFSIGYRGLRSEGKYINQLASTGSFRFTTNYNTKYFRYELKAHFVSHDILNQENGGITSVSDFESADIRFNNRQRLEVYLNDAESFLKGNRVFADHIFRVNSKAGDNNLFIAHQFNYEYKFFQYSQPTVSSTVGNESVNRFGESYATSDIIDQTRYNKMYNKAGLVYENVSLGKFHFFIDDFRSNYYYNQILIRDDKTIPASLIRNINSVGGQYEYQKNKWKGNFLVTRSVTNQSLSNIDAELNYDLNDEYQFTFGYQSLNKLPNDNYNLYQSSYVSYNWSENFQNEKINALTGTVFSPWVTASVQLTTLQDHLYFADVSTIDKQQIIAPSQYGKTINYVSLKLSKEYKFGKFGFDNTLLYQKVDQQDNILNVPELVTRNTVYITDYFFKKALFFQAGLTLNYFTKYLANEYNPVVGEFFVQNKKELGNFPTVDFFINAKIQRTRIYVKAEHFNSALTGNNFFSSPNNPYRDFTVRFGLIWNFFN
jgi:hypothetical protein